MTQPDFIAVADHALLVRFATELSDEAHAAVISMDQLIAADMPVGVTECVPALVNLLVDFDPLITDHVAVEAAVRAKLYNLKAVKRTGAERVVKICYEGSFSPDLAAVAKASGLSQEAVINAHIAGDYRVLMYGFSPGYAYLGGVPASIQVPRKEVAVRDVPAGSVIIAGPQCLVTTLTMPTGWSIIGRSPTQILMSKPEQPFLFDVGDGVRFERISFARFEKEAADG